MDFTQLPMHCTLIAPMHMHALIREQLVKDKKGILGLQILSFSQFLSSFSYEEAPSLEISLFHVRKKIPIIKEALSTYQNIVDTPLFLKECYHFLNDLRVWGILLSKLPQESEAHKEIRLILSLFDDIKMPGDILCSTLNKIKNMNFEHVYILESFLSMEEQQIMDILVKQHAHILPRETYTVNKSFYHAVNKRQEIEACAQYILTNRLCADDIHISLCDPSYQPILQQIFDRYQIPYTLLNNEKASLIAKRFSTLFQFYLYPDNEHILACFDMGLFYHEQLYALREYMNIFGHDFFSPFSHMHNIHKESNVVDAYTLKKLISLEEKAKQAQEQLLPKLHKLKDMSDYEQLLVEIVSIVQKTLKTKEDRSMFQQITQLLQDIYPEITTNEDLLFMLNFFEDRLIHETAKTFHGAFVHGLKDDILNRSYHFLLGANQTNYPAFQTKEGIFDETYYAFISSYPSMEKRYHMYQMQLQKLLCTTPMICISYALGTYEGKSLESALEIEQFIGNPSQPFPLHENYTEVVLQDHIDSITAKDLFLHDGALHGSISSIERYVKCPFAYFLRYGLALQEPIKLGFPDTYAGTLSHFILENLINTYGKQYTQHAEETISQILDQELSFLQEVFPSMKDALRNVNIRLLESMTQTIRVLDDFEQHSHLTPNACEKSFTFDMPLEEATLALHGYIDRLDTSSTLSCILDYKSSVKMLSETNVFAGLQLQLITYAMVIAKESEKEVAGAYYISLKNENIPYPAGSISRRKPITHQSNDKEGMEIERKKARRFHGWTMHKDIEQLDDDASHIVGISMNKDGMVKPRKLYDLSVLSTYLTQMYQQIAHRILQGDIALKPQEEACMFCNYHEICRFKGSYEDKVTFIEVGDEIYQKGEDEDA